MWFPARLIKEWGCVDLSVDTMHLTDPLDPFGFEGSALSLSLFPISPRNTMRCHSFSAMTKDHFLENLYGPEWPCVSMRL